MTAISLLLVVLVSLAWIIAGETPGCPLPAKVAAAQVYANRVDAGIEGGWFGWARPGPLDRLAVAMAGQAPDLVAGVPRGPPVRVRLGLQWQARRLTWWPGRCTSLGRATLSVCRGCKRGRAAGSALGRGSRAGGDCV